MGPQLDGSCGVQRKAGALSPGPTEQALGVAPRVAECRATACPLGLRPVTVLQEPRRQTPSHTGLSQHYSGQVTSKEVRRLL